MNIKTVALTREQYQAIIQTMKQGFTGCRPNERVATALVLVEQKTKKARTFTVPLALYQFIRCYCLDHRIPAESIIFPLTERAVQKHLKLVCDYLGYHGISTHSFRKFYATEIYKDSGYNIALVQQLLQHSSAAVTQR